MAISTYILFNIRIAERYSAARWWGVALLLTTISQFTQSWLGDLYSQTLFPVSFFIGQTTFNAAELKGYFALLMELNTLNRFFWVQVADYIFMITVFFSFFALMAAVYRSLPSSCPSRASQPPSFSMRMKAIAGLMLVIAPLAAIFDALENAVSFILLANPIGFSDWLVYPYSSFALIKFVIFGLTYAWTLLALTFITGHYFTQLFCINRKESV